MSARRTSDTRSGLPVLLRAAVSGLIIFVLAQKIDFHDLLPSGHPNRTAQYLAAGLLATLFGVVLSAWRWQRVLTALGAPTRLGELVSHYLAAQFVGSFLPSTIGGDVLRVSRATPAAGSSETSFASVVLERLTGWLVLPLLVLTGLALDPSLLGLGAPSKVALALALGTLGLLCAILVAASSPRLAGRFNRSEGRARFIGAVHLGLESLRRDPTAASGVLGAAVAYQVSVVATVYLATQVVGVDVPVLALLAFAPAVSIAQVLPFSVGGLGLRESAFVLFLHPLGIASADAVAIGLVVFTMTLVTSLLGAPAFAAGGRSRVSVPAT